MGESKYHSHKITGTISDGAINWPRNKIEKIHFICPQIERDEAHTEIDILKEKLDKALYASQKLIDEKDSNNKDYEKMAEKYERNSNELYRLQSRADTIEADRARLEVETERSNLAATKAREDLRKLQEESTRLQEACDRIAMQLNRAKEGEEKTREELEITRERLEKAETSVRKVQMEKENVQKELERATYELDRANHTFTKSTASFDLTQQENNRLTVDLDKMRERYEKSQSELRRLQEEETFNQSRRVKEDNERLRERLDKTLMELEAIKGKSQYEQEALEKYKGKYESRENEWQTLETKLHETSLQLELSKGEVSKLIANQVTTDFHYLKKQNKIQKHCFLGDVLSVVHVHDPSPKLIRKLTKKNIKQKVSTHRFFETANVVCTIDFFLFDIAQKSAAN